MATRALVLPAGTPDDVVQTYTKALDAALAEMKKDPALSKVVFAGEGPLGPGPHVTGEAAVRNTQRALKFDDAALAWLKDWLQAKFQTKL
jgi:hypothetical protein